ncbi:DUF418 domain-containing protein [bacterium]|nr:DUF418 domain-containing protein [bacterium]
MNSEKIYSQPVSLADRIISLDVLRGFAILGILIMNIQSFSMPESAYMNPSTYGDLTGINRIVYMMSHALADLKFMGLFSMLFGAGVLLFTQRLEARGMKPAGMHYRRTFWLLIIGLVHAYLLWHGDILVIYSLCALTIYLYRKLKPRTLMIVGGIFVLIPTIIYLMTAATFSQIPQEQIDGMMQWWNPGADAITAQLTGYVGSYMDQLPLRVHSSLGMHTFVFIVYFGWRAGGLMLIGMALFKWDVFSAKRTSAFYLRGMIIGFILGFSLIAYGIYHNFNVGWTLAGSMYFGSQFNYIGSLGVAFGYLCMIMLLMQSAKMGHLKARLAATGRMAFSNYLGQTIVCTTIFYGYGLGLFGKVERWQQILFVFGVWALQLWISPIWLKHFKFGPAEWLWRSLTYWKFQPMKLTE